MLESEDGTNRRICQSRHHKSEKYRNQGTIVNSDVRCDTKSKQSGWFTNSFNNVSPRCNKKRKTSLPKGITAMPLSSTPKPVHRPRRRLSCSPPLDTSDALLADLDLESIQSNSCQQNGQQMSFHKEQKVSTHSSCNSANASEKHAVRQVSHSKSNTVLNAVKPEMNDHKNEKFISEDACSSDPLHASKPDGPETVPDTDTSLSDTQESQFTGRTKFCNYRATQPKKRAVKSELGSSENHTELFSQHRCTPFNFSYVDGDAICDKTGDDSTLSVTDCVRECSVSQHRKVLSESNTHCNSQTKHNKCREFSEDKGIVQNVVQVLQDDAYISGEQMKVGFHGYKNVSQCGDVPSRLPCKPLTDVFSSTQLRTFGENSQIFSCIQWNNKDLVSSTQAVFDTGPCMEKQISDVQQKHVSNKKQMSSEKQEFLTQTGYVTITQCNLLEDTHTDTQSILEYSVDSTLLKDGGKIKYRCTPFAQETKSNSQSESNSSNESNCENKTLLQMSPIDKCDKFASVKAVPTQCKSQYTNTQGDQNNVSCNYQRQQTQSCLTQCMVTQLNSSNKYDMTGVIVDSQDHNDPGNDSSCDMFEDSYHDPALLTQIQELDEKFSQSQTTGLSRAVTGHTQAREVISHTQRLSVVEENARQIADTECEHDGTETADGMKQTANGELSRAKWPTGHKQLCNSNILGKDKIEKSSMLNGTAIRHCSVSNESRYEKEQMNICITDSCNKYNKLPDSKHVQVGAIHGASSEKNQLSTVDTSTIPFASGGAGTLQQRIINRLKQNVGQKIPERPALLIEQLREQALAQAQLEADSLPEGEAGTGPFYGLPEKVKTLLHTHRGITSLYDWQDECLSLDAVTNRKNLIYSLPTSGGKTLVAEILILREILLEKRDAMLILPFVSIVQEKVRDISQFAVDLNFHVEEYAGSRGRFPPTKRRKNHSLYIATIEKAHSIVNSLIEGDRMDDLGLVVVDELHMIGEPGSRGAKLESTLMKIMFAGGPTHLIGMSATLNNIDDLKRFLNADIYTSNFRPVKLTEHIKLSENIYRVDPSAKCEEDQFLHDRIVCFQYKPDMEKVDPDHLLGLALEVIPDKSCLVFCPSKKNCENVALMLCELMAKYKRELSNVRKQERKDLLKELYNDSEGKMCPVLKYTIHFGVGYHHSGLTTDERRLIEDAYSAGTLCLLTCTSTLAAGVNLPAKRVILRSPYIGHEFICRSKYKQMVGRAGRAGIDSTGESILICKHSDREKVCQLMGGTLESCHSSLLYDEGKGIRSLLLSTIGLKITNTTKAVFHFMSGSLLKLQEARLGVDVTTSCQEALQGMIDQGLIIQTVNQSEDPADGRPVHSLQVTALGVATFKGSVDPDVAGRLYKDLCKAEESLVIATYLHLLYLVTPYDMGVEPSWFIYFNQMNSLTACELKVAQLIGVPEAYIARRASQQRSKQKVDESVIQRFYLTLMLYDLWKHKSIWEVADKFQQPRGFLQSLLSSAASFASCVSHFCEEMSEFWAYRDLMGNFVKRLSYCVTAELIPLMEISGIKLGRARLMYKAGYQTLSSVANANPEALIKAIQYLPRKVAKQIVASAKLLLNEKAEVMMEQVEELVSVPEMNAPLTMATITTPVPDTPGLSQSSADSEALLP